MNEHIIYNMCVYCDYFTINNLFKTNSFYKQVISENKNHLAYNVLLSHLDSEKYQHMDKYNCVIDYATVLYDYIKFKCHIEKNIYKYDVLSVYSLMKTTPDDCFMSIKTNSSKIMSHIFNNQFKDLEPEQKSEGLYTLISHNRKKSLIMSALKQMDNDLLAEVSNAVFLFILQYSDMKLLEMMYEYYTNLEIEITVDILDLEEAMMRENHDGIYFLHAKNIITNDDISHLLDYYHDVIPWLDDPLYV